MDARATTQRRCAKCTQPLVRVVHVTDHYNRGIPMGRSYQHRCQGCGAQFETFSLWKTLSDGFFAALVLLGGLFLFATALEPLYYVVTSAAGLAALPGVGGGVWARFGGGMLIAALGGLWGLWILWQTAALVRNPPA